MLHTCIEIITTIIRQQQKDYEIKTSSAGILAREECTQNMYGWL